MKLITLNIGIKIDNSKEVLDFINEKKSDIVCLQEVMYAHDDSCFDMNKIGNVLKDLYPNHHFAPIYIADGCVRCGVKHYDFGGLAEQGTMTLTNFKILKAENLFYYNDYKVGYDTTNFEISDWARSIEKVLLEVNGKELLIINVHGLWNKGKVGDDRTINQSEFILKHVRYDIPTIVLGDFNLLPQSLSIKMLDEKLTNLITQFNIKSTRPVDPKRPDRMNQVCDYVFVNDKVKVNDLRLAGENVSDHLALELDFEI